MAFRKKEFIEALSKDKRLLEQIRKDPKAIYLKFGLELSDAQAKKVVEQFNRLTKTGVASPEIIKELAAISFGRF